MMNYSQTIPCPACNTKIPFDTRELLKGTQFTCPNCHCLIGLASESRGVVKETMEKFDEMKKDIQKMKKNNSMS